MPVSGDVTWKDLETRGFVHIPGFLSPVELQACLDDYASKPARTKNANYNTPSSGDGISVVKPSIMDVCARVAAQTTIKADHWIGGGYFATKRGVKFSWHQDHESYFTLQTHANYLNFYIPIIKPLRDKSNLALVPFDVLERVCPEISRPFVLSGATTTFPMDEGQFVVQDDTGRGHALPVSFDSIACTPHLSAGDLLLLRGDIFHKTQDTDTDRVSISVRLTSSHTMVRRSTLADGGLRKSQIIVRNMNEFYRMFRAFDLAGRAELSWGELLPLMDEASKQSPPDSPKLYLLRQKIRSHVVLSSMRAAARELFVNPVKYKNARRRLQEARLQPPLPGSSTVTGASPRS